MKRNTVTVIIGALLVLIFVVLLFTFQVRQTEVAVVTTFDRPTSFLEEPGLKFKWPAPIQKVYKFDRRIQTFEDKYEETTTRDKLNLLVNVYIGWTISNPTNFFNSFPRGTVAEAQPAIESLVRHYKNAVVGRHNFSDFVSTDEDELKFEEIEQQMLGFIRPEAEKNYGITVHFLGIKRLGLPESVTAKVFERMQAERQREVERLQGEGEARAMTIRSNADRERDEILAKAQADAIRIQGEADAEAARYFAILEENPELAVYLLNLRALGEVLKERSTLILDENIPPFHIMRNRFPLTNTTPRYAPVLPGDTASQAETAAKANP
jgi:modulator of FtsH protease HflC